VLVFAITGSTIDVTNPHRTSFHGTGSLVGKPGAWTGYSYVASTRVMDVTDEGTLEGPRMTRKLTPHNPRVHTVAEVDAVAFDCNQLASRRAALRRVKN
jgi:hypothetical protein